MGGWMDVGGAGCFVLAHAIVGWCRPCGHLLCWVRAIGPAAVGTQCSSVLCLLAETPPPHAGRRGPRSLTPLFAKLWARGQTLSCVPLLISCTAARGGGGFASAGNQSPEFTQILNPRPVQRFWYSDSFLSVRLRLQILV